MGGPAGTTHISRQGATSVTAVAVFCLFCNCFVLGIRGVARGPSSGPPGRQISTTKDGGHGPIPIETAIEATLAAGRITHAEFFLRALLKQSQLSADPLLKVGIAFAQHGLYEDAARAFERCVQEHPEIFEAHYDLALAEFGQGRYPQAMAALNAARPQNREQQLATLYMRGKVASALGRPLESERDLAAAFAGNPRQENYALDLGIIYLRQNAYLEAAKVFTKAASFHPHSLFVGLGLALAQYFSGHIPDCIQTCRQFLKQRPDFAPLRVLLAFVFYMQGNLRKTARVATEGLDFPGPHPYLNYIDVVTLLKLQSKEYSRMLSEISIAEGHIPRCSLCYLAQSKIDEARGSSGRAVQDLEAAIRLDPQSAEAWYRLASLYRQTKHDRKAAQARAHFEALKASASQRESDMLRSAFMRVLKGSTD